MGLQQNLERLLALQGINWLDLAQRSGVPTSRISEIVTGKTKNPQLKTLQKLAIALGVTVGQLTTSEPPPSEKSKAVAERPETYSGGYIEAVAEMMRSMDEDTQKDIYLSVQKEKLLRELLSERRDKEVG